MSRAHAKWTVKTKLQRLHARCEECDLVHTAADEDGCCTSCGNDCKIENCYCSKRTRRFKEGRMPKQKAKV